ncbi:GDSL family lipase [Gordoniibacillus kamchatkensis]|uniref:GDSL family lipase n=1 Tax=Gordoniibacillus kamchatkensis TaxID=1590651 RepID=A0ABR5AEL6_9BACL|nr:SGNH/GDSL hydrolase family protein [Paenibacillus sp. VKM B-2647]KIL39491.1 GDSL family lipase [Paenibacillus sp. VKM B-2647]
MKLEKGAKLVMIGDSITDCGRKKPIGEGRGGDLGTGYVAIADAMLQAVYPQLGIRVVNMGLGGNTVLDLKARWETDVLELKPDWLSIMIGINDVWRQFDTPFQTETHVGLDLYEQTLRELVQRTKPQLKGLVLMTPFYIEPNSRDAMRARMDEYGAVVKRIAAEEGAVFVDTQTAFGPVLQHLYPAALCWDRVHPSMTGHMTLAKAFLDAIGFSWNGSAN